jgi:hypothetical protein
MAGASLRVRASRRLLDLRICRELVASAGQRGGHQRTSECPRTSPHAKQVGVGSDRMDLGALRDRIEKLGRRGPAAA